MGVICVIEITESANINFSNFSTNQVADGVFISILGLICALIAISLFILIALHTYLASAALTSWEYFSWMRITYLKVWPKKYGSPFSQKSVKKNLIAFFTPRKSMMAY